MKTEILFGIHPIDEALKARQRRFTEIYITRDPASKKLSGIVFRAKNLAIPILNVTNDFLNAVSKTDAHQGIGAKTSALPIKELADTLDTIPNADTAPMLLILDSLTDPHNFGALVRSAVSVGIHGIIFPKDRSVAPSPMVSKISAGALEHAPLIRATNLVNTIKRLKAFNFWICGLDGAGEQSIFEVDFSDRMAIVIGSEGKGMRPLVRKQCDFLIHIPQIGPISSLNASVAGAIALYEAFRQRTMTKPA